MNDHRTSAFRADSAPSPLKPGVGPIEMMKYISLSLFVCMVISCAHLHVDDCPLKGKWKSNENFTLAEMRKVEGLSKRQIDFLSNDFFGKLKVEFTCNELISEYEGEITKKEYKIIKREGNFITISYFEDGLSEECDYTLELKGDCYYIPLPILTFKEVMCRIKD